MVKQSLETCQATLVFNGVLISTTFHLSLVAWGAEHINNLLASLVLFLVMNVC